MKSRRTLWAAGLLIACAWALWLWTPSKAQREPLTSRADADGAHVAVDAQRAPAATAPPRAAAPSADDELPLLPAEQRDRTLRTVRGPVVGCLTVAGLNTANMDPRMHARLRVAPRPDDGTPAIADFEILNGESAPEVLRACLEQALAKVALSLPPDTEGYVITPPLAGTEAAAQSSRSTAKQIH